MLLIGLAATGYLLILAWNEDAQEARTADYYSAEPEIAGIESARNAIPTERSQPTDAVNDDIPAMPCLVMCDRNQQQQNLIQRTD